MANSARLCSVFETDSAKCIQSTCGKSVDVHRIGSCLRDELVEVQGAAAIRIGCFHQRIDLFLRWFKSAFLKCRAKFFLADGAAAVLVELRKDLLKLRKLWSAQGHSQVKWAIKRTAKALMVDAAPRL
eukprot:6198314-Pleurochrysis_carterae.AAC.2